MTRVPDTAAGRLAVVGVGPGNPELVTVKAARLISEADVVAYPRSRGSQDDGGGWPNGCGRRQHARDIAAPFMRDGQREIAFELPMQSDPSVAEKAYSEAARRIDAELAAGRRVVLLTEGDPLFHGSASRIVEILGARPTVEVVPGVSSPHAAAARLGTALARRDDVYKVLSATLPTDRLRAELAGADAAAVLKVGRHFDRVRAVCESLGLSGRAMLVENVTRADERIVPLTAAEAGRKPYFSLILVARATAAPRTAKGARVDRAGGRESAPAGASGAGGRADRGGSRASSPGRSNETEGSA